MTEGQTDRQIDASRSAINSSGPVLPRLGFFHQIWSFRRSI